MRTKFGNSAVTTIANRRKVIFAEIQKSSNTAVSELTTEKTDSNESSKSTD